MNTLPIARSKMIAGMNPWFLAGVRTGMLNVQTLVFFLAISTMITSLSVVQQITWIILSGLISLAIRMLYVKLFTIKKTMNLLMRYRSKVQIALNALLLFFALNIVLKAIGMMA